MRWVGLYTQGMASWQRGYNEEEEEEDKKYVEAGGEEAGKGGCSKGAMTLEH